MSRLLAAVFVPIALFISTTLALTEITPAQLRERLLRCDTLVLVDVREWSEYTAGHIAEPTGQLPLLPACLPWNSGLFQANYARLPAGIDIVLTCRSGARSASAATFLAPKGYPRVFSLKGGFNAWSAEGYEQRSGGIGSGSGVWINANFSQPAGVDRDSAHAVLYPAAFAGLDSVYCEISYALGRQPAPADAPLSDVGGLFRLTLLDRYGLSLFTGDSLLLADTVGLTFVSRSKDGAPLRALTNTSGATLAGAWRPVPFEYDGLRFFRSETVLRRWYNVAGFHALHVRTRSSGSRLSFPGVMPRGGFDLLGRRIGPDLRSTHGRESHDSHGVHLVDSEDGLKRRLHWR